MQLIDFDTNEVIPQRLDGSWVLGERKEKRYDDIFMEWMATNGYDFFGLTDSYVGYDGGGSKGFCWKSKFYESLINNELSNQIFMMYRETWSKRLFPHIVKFNFTYSLFDFVNLKYYTGIYKGCRERPVINDCGEMVSEKYELKKTYSDLEELYKSIVECMNEYRTQYL